MPQIKLVTVDLGTQKIRIPLAHIQGAKNHPKILVTAGLDGDEYAGIDAAYRLIEKYQEAKFDGVLTVIPIVNVPGFVNRTPFNPHDSKYPKSIFPGNKNGSSTERLIQWLSEIIYKHEAWIDLHGGGLDEYLVPFVYLTPPSNKQLKKRVFSLIRHMPNRNIIYDKKNSWGFKGLDEKGILRLVIEAGSRGGRKTDHIEYHLYLIRKLIYLLNKNPDELTSNLRKKKIFTGWSVLRADKAGIWSPMNNLKKIFEKGDLVGEIKTYGGKIISTVKVNEGGILLFRKTGALCTKGDLLIGLAVKPEPLNRLLK